ncbi:MAG: methyltransferase [Thaumarchaeota archaeon]|nr:methyltransferase [Nitrososphaerota archaeon]
MPRLISTAVERARIGSGLRVATGVDVVGDIAIVRLPGLPTREKKKFAAALAAEVKNVRCVYEQEGGIEGEHRLRKLRHLAGEERTLTMHRENGCVYKVDVARCYFSPRLSTERLSIARSVSPGEKVLNMFAGVGPFSIPVAKIAGAKVTSCEVNAMACRLHRENNRLNKVDGLVTVVRGDVSRWAETTDLRFDRILMPHPSKADEFLPQAVKLARKRATIHYYRHVLGRDVEEAGSALSKELASILPRRAKRVLRKVRVVGPRWVEMAADIRLGP